MKNRPLLCSIVGLLLTLNAFAQAPTHRSTALCGFRVYLTDKNDSPFDVSRPEEFLSQRAIDKRQRYNIAITEEDLPVNPAYVSALRNISDEIMIFTQSKWTNTVTLFCYDTTLLSQVRDLPFVEDVFPIDAYYFGKEATCAPGTFPFRDSTDVPVDTASYGAAYRQIAIHNGHLLHQEGYRGEGMLIAVIDGGWTGFNMIGALHNLYLENRIVGTYNVLPHEDGIYNLTDHGTCCTSTIAADLPYDMIGTAPDASFAFIRTEDPPVERLFEEDFWVRGAEIADSLGADVISSSLGYHNFDDTLTHHFDFSTCDGQWSIASQAATKAAHKGIVVCVAAGNEGMNSWHKLSRPSDAEDILCVGAVNVDSVYAPFSGCGPSYDGRVKPDVAACGWGTYVMREDGSIQSGNGTSFATPIIAGLSACLWQAIPQLNALEIMQIIRESGHQYQNPDTLLGYGIPNFYQAWQSHHTDAITHYTHHSNYRIYPNPTQGTTTLIVPEGTSVRYELFNIAGQLILALTSESAATTIDLNQQVPGIYFLKIISENGSEEVIKLIKQ
ncbi:MAG: S8 family peptidase [Bacteroidales bacterium]|nr:S8 family peptidase [Bacteroidales bacterium]